MLGGREGEFGALAACVDQRIVGFVRARRHIGGGQVGNGGKRRVQLCADRAFLFFQLGQLCLQVGDFGHQALCAGFVLCRLGLPDLLGQVVAAGLCVLCGRDRGTATLVQREQGGRLRFAATLGQGGIEGGGIVADQADVVHGPWLWRGERGLASRPPAQPRRRHARCPE